MQTDSAAYTNSLKLDVPGISTPLPVLCFYTLNDEHYHQDYVASKAAILLCKKKRLKARYLQSILFTSPPPSSFLLKHGQAVAGICGRAGRSECKNRQDNGLLNIAGSWGESQAEGDAAKAAPGGGGGGGGSNSLQGGNQGTCE